MIKTDSIPRAGVVIVAAGRGERLKQSTPKQFLLLAGRPLFSYSLALFDSLAWVTQLVLVVPQSGVPPEQQPFITTMSHPLSIISGGERRQDSVAAGLASLNAPYD